MARMGHSSSAAALRYQHVMAGRDAAIAAALDELIEAASALAERPPSVPSGTRLARIGQSDKARSAADEKGRPLTCGVVVVELRGFEPLTPCMPLMLREFTSPCTTSPTHATEQVRGAAERLGVGRGEATRSVVSGKSLARQTSTGRARWRTNTGAETADIVWIGKGRYTRQTTGLWKKETTTGLTLSYPPRNWSDRETDVVDLGPARIGTTPVTVLAFSISATAPTTVCGSTAPTGSCANIWTPRTLHGPRLLPLRRGRDDHPTSLPLELSGN
jgi:hypothetical protein